MNKKMLILVIAVTGCTTPDGSVDFGRTSMAVMTGGLSEGARNAQIQEDQRIMTYCQPFKAKEYVDCIAAFKGQRPLPVKIVR